MGKTLDLGRRIELLPSDKHCGDISLGLYRRDVEQVAHFLVHTYSAAQGADRRAAFIMEAMATVLGMEAARGPGAQSGWLRFPCGASHQRALKLACSPHFIRECRSGIRDETVMAFGEFLEKLV